MDYNSELEGARQHSIWRASPEGQANSMRVLQNEALQSYDPASGMSQEAWVRSYMSNRGQNDTRQWINEEDPRNFSLDNAPVDMPMVREVAQMPVAEMPMRVDNRPGTPVESYRGAPYSGPLVAPMATMVTRPDTSGGYVQVGPLGSNDASSTTVNEYLDSQPAWNPDNMTLKGRF